VCSGTGLKRNSTSSPLSDPETDINFRLKEVEKTIIISLQTTKSAIFVVFNKKIN